MSDPTTDEHLTQMMREFMANVREEAAKREEHDVVDRVLAAASLAFAALVIAWPKGRPLPWFATAIARLVRQLWKRRAWWLP